MKHLTLLAALFLPAQAQVRLRVMDPLQASGLSEGWAVSPATGALAMTLPALTVPGDINVPVVFRFNASQATEMQSVGVWTEQVNDQGRTHYGYVQNWEALVRPIFGTIHFGFITSGTSQNLPPTGATTRADLYAAPVCTVLEDGTQLLASDFTPFTNALGTSFTLAGAFGLQDKAAADVRVSSNGALGVYAASLAELGTWSSKARLLAPDVTTFQVLLGRDRARILAPLGTGGSWVPVLWIDRFNHAVTFAYQTVTTGLPANFKAVRAVTVLNDRGRGFQLQWVEPAAGSAAPAQVLAQLDYVGIQAQSMQITGYSGTVGGLIQPVAAGPVLRPTEVRFGNPSTLAAPAWRILNPPSTSGFNAPWTDDQVWTFRYDPTLAELTGFTDPRNVATTLGWQTCSLYHPLADANNLYRCVATAVSTDQDTQVSLNRTWTWALPSKGDLAHWNNSFSQTWTGADIVSAPVGSTQIAFYPPTDPKYGNAVPISESRLDDRGRVVSSRTTTSTDEAGVDNSLTSVTGEVIWSAGGPRITVTNVIDNTTGLPIIVTRTAGAYSDKSTTSTIFHPEILDPARKSSSDYERTTPAGTFHAPMQALNWDPTTWFPSRAYRTPWSGGAYQGTNLTYDAASGRATGSSTYGTAPLLMSGNATRTLTREATSGLPTSEQTTFDVPGGTDTITTRWTSYDSADRIQESKAVLIDDQGAEHEVTTTTSWDARGRMTGSSTGGQSPVTTAYPSERQVAVTLLGLTTTTTFDGFGRVRSRVRGGDGVTETYTYDANGLQVKVTETNPKGDVRASTRRYDALGRVTALQPMVGPSVAYAYTSDDVFQTVTTTVSPAGGTPFTTSSTTDLWGQVVSSTDAVGTVTQATYDVQGHPLTMTVTSLGSTQTRSWEYNGMGFLTASTQPETGTTTYSGFDIQGRPTIISDATGRVQTLQIDGLGRVRRVSKGGDFLSTAYVGLRLTSMTSSCSGIQTGITFQHDGFGRLTQETASLTGLGMGTWGFSYDYDSLGRRSTVTYSPSGRVATTVWGGASDYGRVIGLKLGARNVVTSVTYDDWGNRTGLTFASGASNTWAWSTDGLQRVSQTIKPSQTTGIVRSYAYDAMNHLEKAGEWTSLVHDNLGRLTRATLAQMAGLPLPAGDGPVTYGYDGFGNNTSTSGAQSAAMTNVSLAIPPATNRMPPSATNGAVTGWSYAANGEAQTVGRAPGTGTVQLGLTWDSFGRLQGADTDTYSYLPNGLRASRTNSADLTQNRIYAYGASGQLLSEFRKNPSGAFEGRDILYLGNLAIAEVDASGDVHELHSDHLGTPLVVTAGATGQTEGTQYYGPYGEWLQSSGTYVPTTGFTGHLQQEPNGLVYMRGRFYSPVWHRFLNSDGGVDPAQRNQFGYCVGSPMMAKDPSGMFVNMGDKTQTPNWSNFDSPVLPPGWGVTFVRPGFGYSGKQVDNFAWSAWMNPAPPPTQIEQSQTDPQAQIKRQETFNVYYDKSLQKTVDGKVVAPDFVNAAIDAGTKLAASQGVEAHFNVQAVAGLEKAISAQSGTDARDSYLASYASRPENKGANGMIFMLSSAGLQAATGSTNGVGFQRQRPDGFSLIVGGPNTRSVGHELLHHYGLANQRWQNTPPLNEIHNWQFNRIMDRLGIP